MFNSIIIAALTAGSLVSGLGCSDKTNNIETDADLSQLSDCRGGKVSGNIVLGKGLSKPILDGIAEIGGDLTCNGGTNVTSISAPDLTSIGGKFSLKSMTNMNELSMPKLSEVGSIEFQTLPHLSNMQMAVETAESVTITDTVLSTLDGINLKTCDTFDVNNNRYLKEIETQIESVKTSFSVTFNAKFVKVNLPNMIWANNLTFRDVDELKVASLEKVNGSFGMINCTFEDFTAPNLTEVGASLAVVSNNKLTKLSFPELTDVDGGLQVSNNTELSDITGFPKLEHVGGAVDFNGDMDTVKLPKLNDVVGGFNLQTTAKKFNCDPFQKLHDDGSIQGDILCKYDLQEDEVGGLGNDKGGGTTGSDKNAASNLIVSSATLIGAAVVSLFYLL